jgi:steroid delta-isomerase-like uncharacterized protein
MEEIMSPSDIVREYHECWNRRDWERSRSLMHPQYSYTGGDGQEQRGPEAGLAVGQMFATAFPDGRIDIKSLRSDGDFVTVEFIGTGTHKGDLMGVAPTNKKVSIPVCDIFEVRDGKIYREREYMDMMHIMTQLGVAKMPARVGAR